MDPSFPKFWWCSKEWFLSMAVDTVRCFFSWQASFVHFWERVCWLPTSKWTVPTRVCQTFFQVKTVIPWKCSQFSFATQTIAQAPVLRALSCPRTWRETSGGMHPAIAQHFKKAPKHRGLMKLRFCPAFVLFSGGCELAEKTTAGTGFLF